MKNIKYIHLNVDGNHFQSSIDTMQNFPLFQLYFENVGTITNTPTDVGKTKENPVFLDRDYILFEKLYQQLQHKSKHVITDVELQFEKLYYGLLDEEHYKKNDEKSNEEELDDEISSILEFEVNNLLNNPEPYYVNACGCLFQTTKDRLEKLDYFRVMFERFKESNDNVGTKTDPLFLEITPNGFKYLIRYLRNEYNVIPREYDYLKQLYKVSESKSALSSSNTKTTYHENEISTASNVGYNSGQLIQLVARGAGDDRHLWDNFNTGGASSLFVDNKIEKFTESAWGRVKVLSQNSPDWGKILEFDLTFMPRKCDCIGDMYLEIKLQSYENTPLGSWKWKPNSLYRLIKKVQIMNGYALLDEIPGHVLYQESMLIDNIEHLNALQPKFNEKNIRIPIRTFFNRRFQNFLKCTDLCTNIRINIEMSKQDECVILSGEQYTSIDMIYAGLGIKCVYLGTDERNSFRRRNGFPTQGNHNPENHSTTLWTISKQHQYTARNVQDTDTVTTIPINFYHAVEMLVFTLHESENDLFFNGYDGDNTKDALLTADLILCGHSQGVEDAHQLRIINQMECGMNMTGIPIYAKCFGYNMKDSYFKNRIAGFCNFSRLDNVSLVLRHRPGIKKIFVWGVHTNLYDNNNGIMAYSR